MKIATLQQENLRMRDAIRLGKNFYQWLKLQSPKPHKSELKQLQLTYEALQDAITPILQEVPKPDGQFIVVQSCGYPIKSEQWNFIIHSSRKLAELHGKQHYEYANFRIIPFQVFIHTPIGKLLQRRQEIAQRLKDKIKPKKFKLPPSKELAKFQRQQAWEWADKIKPRREKRKLDKAKRDGVAILQHDFKKAQLRGDSQAMTQLTKHINKLKGKK